MSNVEFNKFYGRKIALDLLKKRVLDLKEGYRQNIAFLGRRYVGKSTILKKFLLDLDDKDIVEIYVDCENKDLDYFYHRFVLSILSNYSRSKGIPIHNDISLLMESTQAYIPQTIKSIRRIQSYLSHDKKIEAYREIISLPQAFCKEANMYCVLMLDEFQCLEDLSLSEAFQELGKKIMTQKRCLYVVTSSLPTIAKKILLEKLSLLFGDFETVMVDPLDFKTSQEFIKYQLKELKMGSQLSNFLVDFTGGHPLYLRLLCRELVRLSMLHKQNEIFTPLLNKSIENVLFDCWGVLGRHFEFIVNTLSYGKGNTSTTSILMALSDGKQKIKDVVAKTGIKQSVVISKLNRLVETEIVTKNGYFFYIDEKLFKYWITYVYQNKWKSIDIDIDKQRTQFNKDLSRAIDNFKMNTSRDMSSRIVELLCCFEDGFLNINGRKYKLPLFQKVIPTRVQKSSGGYIDVIKAVTENGDWVVFVERGYVCENDISSILSASKNVVQRPKKCILISPSNLDENARLKALSERMWIWNEGELKSLLNFYDKPYLV